MVPTREQIASHVKLAQYLDAHLVGRKHWVLLSVDSYGSEDEVILADLARQIDQWATTRTLESGGREARQVELGGWSVEVSVIPKGEAAQEAGGTVIANPIPAFAFFPNGQ